MNDTEARRAEFQERARRRKQINRLNSAVSWTVYGGLVSLILLAVVGAATVLGRIF